MNPFRFPAASLVTLLVIQGATTLAAQGTEPRTAQAASRTVIVVTGAPIYLQTNVMGEPLRIAREGSILRLLQEDGGWSQVEFQDPEFGRRVGFIESKFVKNNAPASTLTPLDLSIPEAKQPAAPSETVTGNIPTKYKVWGGVLLGLGAYYFASYAVTDSNRTVCIVGSCVETNSLKSAWLVMGTALTATGALVLAAGVRKSHQSPSISFGPRRIMVEQHVGFDEIRRIIRH